jgi:hypothetical protein
VAHLDYRDNLFYGLGTFDERTIWKEAGFTFSKVRGAWITGDHEVAMQITGIAWTTRAQAHIDHLLKVAEISEELSWKADTDFMPPSPPGLNFLPYQRAGIEYALMRKDTLIADQPGLGKTIQAIGIVNADESIRSGLFVVPASLKVNWYREIDKWMTADLTFGIAEARREERVQIGYWKTGKRAGQPRFQIVEVQKDYWPNTDIVIINYDILDRFHDHIKERAWDYLVCDECHALKTTQSGRTLFVLGGKKDPTKGERDAARAARLPAPKPQWFRAIDANRRVFLSGTPMMSRPIELWPVVNSFDPGGIGKDYLTYAYRYCGAYHDPMRGKNGALVVSDATNLEELGEKLRRKFMVRRLKREVLPELPLKPWSRGRTRLPRPCVSMRMSRWGGASLWTRPTTAPRSSITQRGSASPPIWTPTTLIGVLWTWTTRQRSPAWTRQQWRCCSRRWRRFGVIWGSPSCQW